MSIKETASNAEWEVMRVVWSLDNATSKDVSEILKESQGWENATTKTLLSRLVKKGYLKTKKDGKRFIYQATVSEGESVNQKVEDVFASICATAIGSAIASAIRDHDLTQEDKDKIFEALQKKSVVDTIQCTCASNHHSNCECEPGQCQCHK